MAEHRHAGNKQPGEGSSCLVQSCSLLFLQSLASSCPFIPKRPGKTGTGLPYLAEVSQGHDFGYWPPAKLLFHPELDLLVPLHGEHIESVGQQQQQALPPGNETIQEEDYEHRQVKDVEGDVSEQGPPGEVEDLPGEEGTGADNKKDVEHS